MIFDANLAGLWLALVLVCLKPGDVLLHGAVLTRIFVLLLKIIFIQVISKRTTIVKKR